MSIAQTEPEPDTEQRQVLFCDWAGYMRILDLVGDGHTRVTYDQGKLEMMVPSEKHESAKSLLGLLLVALMEELAMDYQMGGSTTLNRKAALKGLEPDECFWIEHVWRTPEHKTFDPLKDPPPDLAIEIEVSRSSIDRMSIYRTLGVAEVWRVSNKRLRIYRLNADGEYDACLHSPNFPSLPVAEMERFLREGESLLTSQVVRSFRAWVRENLLEEAD